MGRVPPPPTPPLPLTYPPNMWGWWGMWGRQRNHWRIRRPTTRTRVGQVGHYRARHSSCAAIATVESFRIIDPVLYPLSDGSVRKWRCVLPDSAQVSRSRQRPERGGFDWIWWVKRGPVRSASAGCRPRVTPRPRRKMGQRHGKWPAPGQHPRREGRRSTCS